MMSADLQDDGRVVKFDDGTKNKEALRATYYIGFLRHRQEVLNRKCEEERQ